MSKQKLNPEVSVIVPVLNGEIFIREALKSALNQTFQDFEIIVVDGGSSDKTISITKELSKKDERIKLVKQPVPGLASARNYGISVSKGKYIAILEADDLWDKNKLLLQTEYLEKNPAVGLVSCYSVIIDENGLLLGWKLGTNVNGMVYKEVIKRNPVSSGSVPLIRRKYLADIGEFNTEVKSLDDGEMWIRFAKKYPIYTIPKALVGYRRHKENKSSNYLEIVKEGETILEKIFHCDPSLPADLYKFCLSRNASTVAGMCLIDRNYKEARKWLIYSLKRNKFVFLHDFRMLGIATLIFLALLLPHFIFEKIILQFLLPLTFGVKPGKKFGVNI